MAEAEFTFRYVAVDQAGRRVKGAVAASDDTAAFEKLKLGGLAPIKITAGGGRADRRAPSGQLNDRDLAAMLADLAALTSAGADMRTAFAILSSRSGSTSARTIMRALSGDIAGGASLESAFAKHLPARFDFVAALIAAGESSGDLAAGFQRAADMLSARIKLQDQFVSIISYPAFVLVSTLAAVGVILFVVIPSLAPILHDETGPPPALLAWMVGFSELFTRNAVVVSSVAVGLLVAAALAVRAGLMRGPMEAMLLDGPARQTVGGIVYGGFAVALGAMLAGGAPIGEALRLAIRSVGMSRARRRLESVAHAVRQGVALSVALDAVPSFPSSIGRLAAVGEASGALGVMLARAGRREEDAAVRRIENGGRVLGPALIVVLGGVIGLLMGGLLSGVSQLGQTALQ
jgi:type II secretory pathway component PulF